MINYRFTPEDVKLVEKLIEIKQKGFYADGKQVTEVYNRVLDKKAAPTNCGSCIRQRVSELEGALNHFKALEAKREAELNTVKEEENKELKEAGNNLKSKRKK